MSTIRAHSSPSSQPDGGSRELREELRALLDRREVLWDFEAWNHSTDNPACWRSELPRKQALTVWAQLRDVASESGCWPVIVGAADDEAAHAETAREAGQTFAATLQAGLALDTEAWFANEASLDPELLLELEGTTLPRRVSRARLQPDGEAPWKRNATTTLFWIETPHAWQVPAALGFGGWNSCPPPAVHVALLKRWHDRWGAVLVGLSRQRLTMQAKRKPPNRNQALALAREQFLYCEELVLAEHGSLEALAAARMASDVWSFRWD